MKSVKIKPSTLILLLLSVFFIAFPTYFASAEMYDVATITTSGFVQSNGTIADLAVGDADIVAFAEPNGGAVPIYVDLDFTSVSVSGAIDICFYGRYMGSSAHQVSVQAYNYTSSAWVTFGFILNSAVYGWVNATIPLANFDDFVSSETFSLRLYHLQNGISSHVLYVDTLIIDTTPRDYVVFEDFTYSSSVAGSLCTFSAYIFEHELGSELVCWRFSTNNTGTWANDTAVTFAVQTGEWANVTKILNSNIGTVVAFQYFASELDGEVPEQHASEIKYLTVTEAVTSPTINESTTSLFLFFGLVGIFILLPILMLTRRSRR